MKTINYIIIFSILALTSLEKSETKVYVLLYHTFYGTGKHSTDVSIADLKKHISILKRNKFRFVSFQDIIKGNIRGTKNILFTIDDGNVSGYRAYHSVFKPNDIKPLFAIYPHVINKRRYAMTWKMVNELSNDGCEIAAHGYYHLYVNQKLYRYRKKFFLGEIYKSKNILEKNIKKNINTFVYPYGSRSPVTIRELKKGKYTYAFNIKWGALHYPLKKNDLYNLPRFMYNSNWNRIFNYIKKDSLKK